MQDNSQIDQLNAQGEQKNSLQKTVLYIALLAGIVIALTFSFKLVALINSVPLRIAVFCLIYCAYIASVFFVCFLEKRKVRDLGFFKQNIHVQILIGVGIAVGMAFLIGALPILIGGSQASLVGDKQTDLFNIIYTIVIDLVFIGTFEELIFRGYIQTRINELTKHKFVGVLIAGVLFGLWHIINGSWIQVLFTTVIGCVFGFCRAYLKNCSLLSVIVAHGLYDALLVVVAIVLL